LECQLAGTEFDSDVAYDGTSGVLSQRSLSLFWGDADNYQWSHLSRSGLRGGN
jgi:hypothetical protein